MSFGSLTAVLMHTLLFNYREIFSRFRAASEREDDVHTRLYRRYQEVPDWWYYGLFLFMMVCTIIVCEAWDTRLPWWGFLVTQLIPFVFTLPIGMVAAVTNVGIGLFLKQTMLTGRIECDHRVYCRIHVPWETIGKYDDQDVWIHDCVTGTTLRS
jgi:hypothetical protein